MNLIKPTRNRPQVMNRHEGITTSGVRRKTMGNRAHQTAKDRAKFERDKKIKTQPKKRTRIFVASIIFCLLSDYQNDLLTTRTYLGEQVLGYPKHNSFGKQGQRWILRAHRQTR